MERRRKSVRAMSVDGGDGERRSIAITVAVRIRPRILPREESESEVVRGDGSQNITVYAPKLRVDLTPIIEPTTFRFDNVFDEHCSNAVLYEMTAKLMIDGVVGGGTAIVFAFGQTGSGKTYTMLGTEGNPGLYSLAADELFAKVAGTDLHLSASFFEVYGPKLYDLLNDRAEIKALQDEYSNVHVVGLVERIVNSHEDLMSLMHSGAILRSSGTTHANDRSSRSHAVLHINIRSTSRRQVDGKFTFVDLAGSERASDTINTDKKTRREGAEINKSLLALKECIRAMGMRRKHVPFRGSKLTQLLRESFVGNCTTCLIANVSPCGNHCEDTLNTLRYADRVKELKSDGEFSLEPPVPCSNCGQPIFVGDRHVCLKVSVQCSYCRQTLDKEAMEQHLLNCKDLPTHCPHCNLRVLQVDVGKHEKRCPKFPISCTLCQKTVPRETLAKHIQTDCALGRGSCRYCSQNMQRSQLSEHEENCGSQILCCPHCTMPVKKSKLAPHMLECPSARRVTSRDIDQPSPPDLKPARSSPTHRLPPQPPASVRSRDRSAPPSPTPPPRSLGSPPKAPRLPPVAPVAPTAWSVPPLRPVPGGCPHCQRRIPPEAMERHVGQDCAYALQPCVFAGYGCGEGVPRMLLAKHLEVNMAVHLALVQHYAETLARENDQLKLQVGTLKEELSLKSRHQSVLTKFHNTVLLDDGEARSDELDAFESQQSQTPNGVGESESETTE